MEALNQGEVWDALRNVQGPGGRQDVVSLGLVRRIKLEGRDRVRIYFRCPLLNDAEAPDLAPKIKGMALSLPLVRCAHVVVEGCMGADDIERAVNRSGDCIKSRTKREGGGSSDRPS
jgi:hypothetical protein